MKILFEIFVATAEAWLITSRYFHDDFALYSARILL